MDYQNIKCRDRSTRQDCNYYEIGRDNVVSIKKMPDHYEVKYSDGTVKEIHDVTDATRKE